MFSYEAEQEKELSLYPKDYTFLEATQNGNVVAYDTASYNIHRMEHFLNNYIHKTPDKVVLVYYHFHGYPSIGILEYTGDLIVYTVRHYKKCDVACYITYYGTIVFKHHIVIRDMVQRVYSMKTFEDKDVTVFRVLLGKCDR